MTEKEIKTILSEVPQSFTDAIYEGFGEIRRRERRKRKIILSATVLCAAAIFCLVFMRFQLQAANDAIVTSMPSPDPTDALQEWVMVYPDDPYYHCDPTCRLANNESVSLPLETAVELQKRPCAECSNQEALQ